MNGLADLITDPGGIRTAVNGITDSVALSYLSHPMKNGATKAENARRAQICIRLLRVMRGDLGWSVQRCVDTLGTALTSELDDVRWTPPKNNRDAWFTRGVL